MSELPCINIDGMKKWLIPITGPVKYLPYLTSESITEIITFNGKRVPANAGTLYSLIYGFFKH
ncbi:hypothetical protein PSI22_20610 [Xenorhabdus sp. XENO-7]|uniref:Transposase n=1 Tax=Xenorhabdus aichiensis TaxID=3025874 RepID=A0ABT5M8F4_9GAMM|nr:hypothetical protein [Xenorhabdus aichiensis]MDC9623971.1 hypothetical protein [Xenorhabdus aichiensis]